MSFAGLFEIQIQRLIWLGKLFYGPFDNIFPPSDQVHILRGCLLILSAPLFFETILDLKRSDNRLLRRSIGHKKRIIGFFFLLLEGERVVRNYY